MAIASCKVVIINLKIKTFMVLYSLLTAIVLNEGLFSKTLTQQVYNLAPESIAAIDTEVIFAYKTSGNQRLSNIGR